MSPLIAKQCCRQWTVKKFSETYVPSCFPTSSWRTDALPTRNLTYFIVLFWVDKIRYESKHKPCFLSSHTLLFLQLLLRFKDKNKANNNNDDNNDSTVTIINTFDKEKNSSWPDSILFRKFLPSTFPSSFILYRCKKTQINLLYWVWNLTYNRSKEQTLRVFENIGLMPTRIFGHKSRNDTDNRSNSWHVNPRNKLLGAFVKLWKATISFVRSACLSASRHVTTWFPLGGISWNLILEYFSQTCRENFKFH
jgi:hypothetical protein